MARAVVAASTQFLEVASPAVTGSPLTLACWYKTPNLTNRGAILALNNSANDVDRVVLYQYDGDVYADAQDSVNLSESYPGPALSTDTWRHAAVVFASSTSVISYLDAVAGPTGSSAVTPAGINRLAVGRQSRLNPTDYITASIAEVAVWNIALSGAQLTALAAGDSPMSLATEPVAYWRLRTDGDFTDTQGGTSLTNSGSTFDADNPTVDDPPAAAGNSSLKSLLLGIG